jgi:hypothetical protein
MYAHLLLQHVLSSAYQQAARQLPEDHQEFLVSRVRRLDARLMPNTHFVLDSFAALRGDDAFAAGLSIIGDAIARESAGKPTKRPRGSRDVRVIPSPSGENRGLLD